MPGPKERKKERKKERGLFGTMISKKYIIALKKKYGSLKVEFLKDLKS